MAYKIIDSCNNCRACEPECPNEAISEGADIYEINPDKCTECVTFNDAPACAAICPVDACIVDDARIESEPQLIEKVKQLHPGKTLPDSFPSHFRK